MKKPELCSERVDCEKLLTNLDAGVTGIQYLPSGQPLPADDIEIKIVSDRILALSDEKRAKVLAALDVILVARAGGFIGLPVEKLQAIKARCL